MMIFPHKIQAFILAGLSLLPLMGEEIFNGTEFRTGYRTDYLYNGRHIAKNVVEAQVSGGLALSNYCDFNFSGQAYQALSESFGNLGGFGEFVFYLTEDFHLRPFASANLYNESEFTNGVEWGLVIEQQLSQSWSWEVMGLYDTGQKGSYGNVKLHYFPMITTDVGIRFTAGTGVGYDYFETRGINEYFGRVSIPVRVGDSWVIEPFAGVSSQHGQRGAKERVYFGLWASFMY